MFSFRDFCLGGFKGLHDLQDSWMGVLSSELVETRLQRNRNIRYMSRL